MYETEREREREREREKERGRERERERENRADLPDEAVVARLLRAEERLPAFRAPHDQHLVLAACQRVDF